MGFTPEKLAAKYGSNSHTVYKLSKDREKFVQNKIDNPYSSIQFERHFQTFRVLSS